MKYLSLLVVAFFTANAQAQNTEMPLYKNIVPNSIAGREGKAKAPSITIYRPAQPNGKAVVVCPGGGYAGLSFDKEGTLVAEEMSKWGITAFVLRYRLPDDSTMTDRSVGPLQDAQQAIRLLRTNAREWGLNKDKIGIMGFSAGGHLAATAATHFDFKADASNSDTVSVRPDFAILVYAVISFDSTITHKGSRNKLIGSNATSAKTIFFSNELQVTKNTPPAFLVHAGDDGGVPVENSIRFYQACIKNQVQVEMHLYPKGGHGFGMFNRTTDDNWMERLKNWVNRL